jgi:putative hydrolase of the HAD superfamily
MRNKIKVILFDFGGVIAEEGFREGLMEIGRAHCLDPDAFCLTAETLIIETGYLIGHADECTFWDAVRMKTGIIASDTVLRNVIIKRFKIRFEMIRYANRLRSKGLIVAMLSDQTNWLDEIDRRSNLFQHFDRIFNSFHTHKNKLDATVFRDVCAEFNIRPAETLFIDDNINHIKRAKGEGLNVIHFTGVRDFEKRITEFVTKVINKT